MRRGSVTLEWETPTTAAREERAGVSGYLIERQDVGKDTWLPVKKLPPKVKSYEVPGLPAGRQYMFRVRSIGIHGGLGEAVMPETPFTVADRYSQYRICVADTSAWEAMYSSWSVCPSVCQ